MASYVRYSFLTPAHSLLLKILSIRLTRQETAKNLEYLKNEAVTHFSCSQYFVYNVCIFHSLYQSKSLRKMINDLRYTNADLKVSPYAWLSIKTIP